MTLMLINVIHDSEQEIFVVRTPHIMLMPAVLSGLTIQKVLYEKLLYCVLKKVFDIGY